MAILEILHFPDPRLRTRAQPVQVVDDSVRRLVDDMFETMYAAPGIGLASIQVNDPRRVIVIDISEDRSQPRCFINPEVIAREGEEEMERARTAGRPHPRACARPRRQPTRAGRGGPAGRVHTARDRSPRRQAVRRLLVQPEATAHPQEAREGRAQPCREAEPSPSRDDLTRQRGPAAGSRFRRERAAGGRLYLESPRP